MQAKLELLDLVTIMRQREVIYSGRAKPLSCERKEKYQHTLRREWERNIPKKTEFSKENITLKSERP